MPLGMLGKYEKLDVLGHGASGIVFLAKDTLLNRQVALKVVNLQAGDMQHFLEEARVLDRLRHPHIVRVHNVDRIDGNIVLDMEYVRGKNVQEMLREQGPLPEEYALEIAAQTLDALEYAHQMQTVHRDIKPANILISRQGEVKLVDFGLAEILATNAYAGGAGTYAYMAPEDFAEENRSDHLSDIWAVGVTLYEMLTGQRPFQVSRPKDPFAWKRVLDNDLTTPLVAYLPGATAELQAVLNRALAKEKNRRYATAAAFRDDIRRLQAGQTLDSRTLDLDPDPTGLHTVPS
jgi:serine/threonine protein kinase